MQHKITVMKIRKSIESDEYLGRLPKTQPVLELNQKKNPWLLYWSQWYDPWSMSQDLTSGLQVDEIVEGMYEIVDQGKTKALLEERLKSSYQWKEVAWFHRRILEAIYSYENLTHTRIIVLDECVGASLDDSELQ